MIMEVHASAPRIRAVYLLCIGAGKQHCEAIEILEFNSNKGG